MVVGRRRGPPARINLLDHVPEMVTISDRRGTIVYANPATERVSGYAPEEFMALDPFERMHPEDRPRCEEAFEELAHAPGLSISLEHRVRHKDGRWCWVEGTYANLFDDPEVGGLLATVRDVTERKRAEEALRESEESLRLAVDAASLGRWEYSIRGEELRGYAAFNEHHRAAPDADLGMEEHLEAMHPADRETVRKRVARTIEEGGEYEVEYRVPRPDGTTRRILSRGRFVGGEDPTSDRLVGVTMDVTERRELEEEKEKARARALSSRAEAAEREKIGRELHDRVAHTMGMAHHSLELYSALAQSAPERAREKLGLAKEATRTALDQTRDLSAQLARRETEETQDGLTSALRELLGSHLPDSVEGDLSAEGNEKALPPIVKEQAYLVMREAVRNAVTHSGCQRVGVSVEVDGGELRGRVEDDGEGFDQGETPDGQNTDGEDGNQAEGVGLRSMKERTELLGGRLEISSQPGGGTAVEVRLPLTD
jgi:PAS domain S-box-containing protein